MMTSDDAMRSELSAMQLRADQIADESLDSTRRMVALGLEAQEAGAQTLVMLDEQGEQLDRIEEGIHQIDEDMKVAERHLNSMQKCCGLCICPWNRTASFDEREAYKSTWRTENDGDVVRSQRKAAHSATTQQPTGGYVERVTNDAREDEMDENLGQVSGIIGNLKDMAINMGNEIDRQNQQIDRINDKAEITGTRIDVGNKRAAQILKS